MEAKERYFAQWVQKGALYQKLLFAYIKRNHFQGLTLEKVCLCQPVLCSVSPRTFIQCCITRYMNHFIYVYITRKPINTFISLGRHSTPMDFFCVKEQNSGVRVFFCLFVKKLQGYFTATNLTQPSSRFPPSISLSHVTHLC